MSFKTKIKNDLWRINYIVPFAKKHLNDEDGALLKAKAIADVALSKRVAKGGRPRTVAKDIFALFSKVDITFDKSDFFLHFIDERTTIAVPGNVFSNFAIDYGIIVNGAFDAVLTAATSKHDRFSENAVYIYEGLRLLVSRTMRAAEASGRLADDGFYRACFSEMFSRPAVSFREGLQRVLFFNQVMWQTRHRLNGLGRLDKVLGGLYETDLAEGVINEQLAREMVFDFLSVLHGHYDYKSDALMGDIGQIIVLGGLEPDGSYFRNGLTDLFLECQAELGYPDPKVFLRVSAGMPRDLVDKVIKALRSSTGSPLLSNDDRVIPELKAFGVEFDDAHDYCVSACWEPLVPGKSIGQNNMAVFDACAAFFDAFMLLDGNESFEDVLVDCTIALGDAFASFLLSLDEFKWAEDPLVSLLYPECVQSRVDISCGGARYCNYGVTTVGLANVVDSVFNLWWLMERGASVAGLQKLLASDFKGYGEVVASLKGGRCFGSDAGCSAEITNMLTEHLDAISRGYRNPFGGKVKFGLSSPAYIMLGKGGPADLSGRRAGEPYTVHISSGSAVYTELVNFSGALDYSGHRFNGNVVDFFVAPNLLAEHPKKFADFLIASMSVGFFQMQMNVLDSTTLIDAKDNPGKYPGLVVRVWGFSAYFDDLPNSYKNYLIERALELEAIS